MAKAGAGRHLGRLITRRAIISNLVNLGVGVGGALLLRDQVFWREPAPTIAGGQTDWLDFAQPNLATITVAARVNGVEVQALVDSGAERSVIHRGLARKLGLGGADLLSVPLVAYGVGGKAQVGEAVTLAVEIGGLQLANLRAASLALGPVADDDGPALPLILGQDMLSTVIAEFDFPGRRLRFAAPEEYAPPVGAVAAPVRRRGRGLMVPISIEASEIEVLLDTGASAALVLAENTAEAAGLMAQRPVRTARSVVLGGELEGRAVTAAEMRFGGELFENVDVHIFETPMLPLSPAGLLGYGTLRRFRAIFDHGGGRLFLMS